LVAESEEQTMQVFLKLFLLFVLSGALAWITYQQKDRGIPHALRYCRCSSCYAEDANFRTCQKYHPKSLPYIVENLSTDRTVEFEIQKEYLNKANGVEEFSSVVLRPLETKFLGCSIEDTADEYRWACHDATILDDHSTN